MKTELRNVLETASPEALVLYRSVCLALRSLGPFREEVKKTSVHLARKSAFTGVHFRKSHLVLTLKAEAPIESPRVSKAEQVSKNRWHCEIKVESQAEVDAELLEWAKQAYELCG